MPATIFSGTKVKALKKIMDLNGGVQIHSSTVDPTSSATDATIGSLLINETTGNIYKKLDSGSSTNWELVEFGAGGINYADGSSSDFEANVGAWAAYADAAASSPVDGTGGSPTVTITRTTSSPLRGIASGLITKDAANRQGEGISLALTIDSADKAKVLRVSADYEVASGTFSYGDGTVASPSDLRVFIYDITNAVIIEPTQTLLDGSGQIVTEFQASSNSTSYRLILHVATVSASAWTFKFDNVQVGPRELARGPIDQDLGALTTTGTWTTNTTYTGQYYRKGNMLHAEVKIALSGAPNAVTLEVNLPAGLTADITKIFGDAGNENYCIGSVTLTDEGVANYVGVMQLDRDTPTVVQPFSLDDAAAAVSPEVINATAPFTWANTDVITIRYAVPIVGWASNIVTSSDSGTRTISFGAYKDTSAQTASSGVATEITFNVKRFDTNASYSTSTGRFTAKESGYYSFKSTIQYLTGATPPNSVAAYFLKNGTGSRIGNFLSSVHVLNQSYSIIAVGDIYLNAGDYVSLWVLSSAQDVSVLQTGSTNDVSSFYGHKIQSPQSIGMADPVLARIGGDAPSASSGNPLIFPTVAYDTHGAYNATTGRYTAPTPGYYRVHGFINSANAGVAVQIYVNAVAGPFIGQADANGDFTYTGTVKVNAGDLIDLRPNGTLDPASQAIIHFERIG